ncbi:translation initiation factor IF-1 [Candidatus Uhrbacteria bacterium RIFCSPHIGHO2_12_FULL_60_25]|uniref:Translation initiation factor IF-1 n=1 Tax=Candidatus Uhrbacteria bacterium RIFCSPHIGHO2_12_FULL_60_25 TaxID=1802399 RepID=A0A1F7ULG6_9BACT|nr:MAG: translation initiation factor IF-1 [Candidatus Uhrbacteria bacterium RIFCSPHIGHO2_02_FULL_60_44]OGL79085.1 MAG: translation initiation factor IF-1 [Candidatus Uhrbacteria bacterium RIFCSPHIGHO2_12_FULL_60_25]
MARYSRNNTQGPASPSKDFLVVKGIVQENLPAASFRVKLENGQMILCHMAGKLRKHRIRLTPGDEVQIEISPYDLTKGRIIYRF